MIQSFVFATTALFLGGIATIQANTQLDQSPSSFLKRFSDSPVHWREWNQETIDLAKKEDKPIFLFVGYFGSFWCERMRVETFGDKDIAQSMNKSYINVVIDKDADPAMNSALAQYCALNRQPVGWPMCVWLSPELVPFTAGSFFLPEATSDRPSFGGVIEHIDTQWKKRREYVKNQSQNDRRNLLEAVEDLRIERRALDPAQLLSVAYTSISSRYVPSSGSFSSDVGLPNYAIIEHLSYLAKADQSGSFRSRQVQKMLINALECIAASGLNDHLDGGFFRYAEDPSFEAPSFEMDLNTQAMVILTYSRAISLFPDQPFLQATVEKVLAHTLESFRLESGFYSNGFHGYADADGNFTTKDRYYSWTVEEIDAALTPEESREFQETFSIRRDGNLPSILSELIMGIQGRNVPRIDRKKFSLNELTERETLQSAIKKLRIARNQKGGKPERDSLASTSSNALLVSSLALASHQLSRPELAEKATELCDLIFSQRYDSETGRLAPSNAKNGTPISPDYSFLINACLSLALATNDSQWLQRADALQKAQIALFWDDSEGVFLDVSPADNLIEIPAFSATDYSVRGGNSLAAENLVRLAKSDPSHDYTQKAKEILSFFSLELTREPLFALGMSRVAQEILE